MVCCGRVEGEDVGCEGCRVDLCYYPGERGEGGERKDGEDGPEDLGGLEEGVCGVKVCDDCWGDGESTWGGADGGTQGFAVCGGEEGREAFEMVGVENAAVLCRLLGVVGVA